MADYSQDVYNAASQQFRGDYAGRFEQALRDAFDISFAVQGVQQEFMNAAMELQRPSILYKPTLSKDGNAWIALLGENLQVGVVGVGDSPAKAVLDFDREFYGHPRPVPTADKEPTT